MNDQIKTEPQETPQTARPLLSDELMVALKKTGFVICEFTPDDDPCECCGKQNLQHYWRGSDPFSGDGTYYCAQCVLDEHESR